jgi:hypothetical protein
LACGSCGALTIVFVFSDGLGAAEWGHIAAAVKGHLNLRDLADFEWSRSVLEQDSSEIKLDKTSWGPNQKALGNVGAVVLGHLLQRSGSSIKTLRLR